MKFFEFLKNKKKELLKPELVDLVKYKAIFKTVDGEWHEFNKYNYADPESTIRSIPEYIMIDNEYMRDDDFNIYPLQNVICIKWEIVDTIENVIKKRYYSDMSYIFYEKEDIEIWSEGE